MRNTAVGAAAVIGLTAVIVACMNGNPTLIPPAQLTTAAVTATVKVPESADSLTVNCAASETARVTALLEELRSCRSDLSQDTKELIRLFIELQGFKSDAEFLRFGFGVCCRFNPWLKEVEALRDSAGYYTLNYGTLNELGILPVDLLELGQVYLQNSGQSTEHTKNLETRIKLQARKTMGLVTYLPTPTVNTSLGTEIVGVWIYEFLGTKDRLTVFKQGGQLRMEWLFSDGSRDSFSIVESQSPSGRRFDAADQFEHYIIDRQGNLQIWDPYGLITTARKVK